MRCETLPLPEQFDPPDGQRPAGPHGNVAEVEARIADELARLIQPERLAGRRAPSAYVRRHLVEHAVAGGVLDQRILSVDFLPFADAGRLRALTAGPAFSAGDAGPLLQLWRRAAHAWSWESPAGNASTLSVWACVQGTPLAPAHIRGVWEPRWGWWQTGSGEILGHHVGWVSAVAALVLPSGRPVAVTGSADGTARVWDLARGCAMSYPVLHLPDGVHSLVVRGSGDRPVVMIAGAGLIAVTFPAEEL